MWRDPESQIAYELSQGERLLWAGRPRQGVLFHAFDMFMVPFGLIWTGLLVSALISTSSSRSGPPPFILAPFVLVGLYMLFGRFIIDAMRRDRTSYGVTDQRVIIISGVFSRRVESLNLRTLSDLSLREKRDGTGTISFGSAAASSWLWWSSGYAFWSGAGHPGPAFETIENAKEVYDLIRTAQQGS